MTKSPPWTLGPSVAPPAHRARSAVAKVLRSASAVLALMARRVRVADVSPPAHAPVLEFYASAGAPEGALYVDGRLVGRLPGVLRL